MKNRNGRFGVLLLICALVFATGCVRRPPSLDLQSVNRLVVTADKLPAITGNGSLKVRSSMGSGSLDFLLAYSPPDKMRLELVDPLYRPVQSAVIDKGIIYLKAPGSGSVSRDAAVNYFKRTTGVAIEMDQFFPLMYGRIPGGDWIIEQDGACEKDDHITCFDFKDKYKRIVYKGYFDLDKGRWDAILLPSIRKGQPPIRITYAKSQHNGYPRWVKMENLDSKEYFQLRFSELKLEEAIDPSMFDLGQVKTWEDKSFR